MNEHQFEFNQLSENIRHWEKLRWVSMTVFIAMMFGLATALFQWNGHLLPSQQTALKVISLVLVVIFWIQDERIVQYWFAYKIRAHSVEDLLQIKVFSASPVRGVLSAGNAVRSMYIAFFIMWILLLFHDA